MSKCRHTEEEGCLWRWEGRGYSPLVPGAAVYCSECDTMLFGWVYDPDTNTHRVSFPRFHTLFHRDYILNTFRKAFPNDYVKEVRWEDQDKPSKVNTSSP